MRLPDRAQSAFFAGALLLHLYAFPYFGALKHANELPRVMTTQQLVTKGTFRLDDRMGELGSHADVSTTPDGHHYQNKAPGLTVLATPVYGVLALVSHAFGAAPSLRLTTWLLRVTMVTLPAVLFLGIFRRVAARFANGNALARDGALVAYALGSLVFPYALLFMSHVPATLAVGTAFALASALTRGETRSVPRSALAVGACLGLAMFVEYQAVFAAAIIGLFVLVRAPRGLRTRAVGAVVAGATPFLGALALYHWLCFGSPLRTGYAYSVDPANRVGFMGLVGPSTEAVTQLFTLASNGLLVLSPWVLLAVAGAVVVLRDPERRRAVGAETVVAAAICLTYLVFVASLAPEFGRAGWCVGPRYIAVAMPFFAWLAAAGLARCVRDDELGIPALGSVLAAVLVNVLAATTYPHWPTQFLNPVFEVSGRLLREGYAPHSLGTALGLRGVWSLAPLYLAVTLAVGLVLKRAGGNVWRLVGAAVLAAFALSRFENFATTPEPLRSETWSYVTSTYEP